VFVPPAVAVGAAEPASRASCVPGRALDRFADAGTSFPVTARAVAVPPPIRAAAATVARTRLCFMEILPLLTVSCRFSSVAARS
jgi:hypothetical protein